MNSYLSKDYLDSFYSKPVDEHYFKQRNRNNQINNSNNKKSKRKGHQKVTYDSTSAEEDCNDRPASQFTKSIFNNNLFETKKQKLKIKDVLTHAWRENLLFEKNKIFSKILRIKFNDSFYTHN